MRTIHTSHGPGTSTVEIVRDTHGNDTVRITADDTVIPREAYRFARLIDGAAYTAASHNAGEIT